MLIDSLILFTGKQSVTYRGMFVIYIPWNVCYFPKNIAVNKKSGAYPYATDQELRPWLSTSILPIKRSIEDKPGQTDHSRNILTI